MAPRQWLGRREGRGERCERKRERGREGGKGEEEIKSSA